MAQDGSLTIKIDADDKGSLKSASKQLDNLESKAKSGIKVNITNGAMNSLNAIDSKVNSIAKTAAGIAFKGLVAGGAAIAGGLIASVKSAGDLEQSIGGVEKIFEGIASQDVMANARKGFETAGVSMNEYMETATSFGPRLLSDLGGNAQLAAKQVDKAMIQMADNSNTFGTALGSLEQSFQGFAKGNYTMLDNLKLGYGGTGEEMMRLVKDAGVVEREIESMNDVSFSEIIDSIGVIQDRLKITGTTAKEAATTLNGSFTMAKKAFANFLATGEGSDQVIDSFMNFGSIAFKMANELAPKLWAGIKSAFAKIKPQIPGLLADIFGGVATTIGNMFGIKIAPKIFDSIRNMKFGDVASGAQKAGKAILGFIVAVKGLKLATTIMSKFGVIGKGGGGSLNPFAEKGAFVADLKKSAASFIKNAGNLALIYAAVKIFEEVVSAIKQLENVPSVGDVGSKLLSVGVAVLAVGGAMVLIGLALDKIQGAKKVLITGGIALLGISFVMKDLSKAMKEIDKNVPTDVGSVATKMLNLGIAVGAISLLAGVLGALVSTGIGALIAGAGLTTLEAVAHSMSSLAKAIGKINTEVPSDVGSVEGKIKTLVSAVEAITSSGLGNALDVIKGVLGAAQASAADIAVGALISIASKVQELNGMGEVPDVTPQLKILDKDVAQIQNASSTFGSVKVANTENAVKVLDDLLGMVPNLEKLNSTKIPDVTEKLTTLDKIVAKIQNTTTTLGTLKAATVSTALEVFDDLIKLVDKLPKLAEKEIPTGLYTKIDILDKIVEKIQNTTTNYGSLTTKTVGNAVKVVDDLVKLASKMSELDKAKIPDGASEKLTKLDEIVEKIQNTTTNYGSLVTTTVAKAIQVVADLVGLSKKVEELNGVTIPTDVVGKLDELDTIIEGIQDTTTTVGKIKPEGITLAMTAVDSLKTLIGKLLEVGSMMTGFVAPDFTAAKTSITALSGLGGADGVTGVTSAVTTLIPQLSNLSTALKTAKTSSDELKASTDTLATSYESTMTKMTNATKAMVTSAVTEFERFKSSLSNMLSSSSAIISSYTSVFNVGGVSLGKALADGIQSQSGAIMSVIDQIASDAASRISSSVSNAKAQAKASGLATQGIADYLVYAGVDNNISITPSDMYASNKASTQTQSSKPEINVTSKISSAPVNIVMDGKVLATALLKYLVEPLANAFDKRKWRR